MPPASATRARARQASPNHSMSSSIDELALPLNEVNSSPTRLPIALRQTSPNKRLSPSKQTKVLQVGSTPTRNIPTARTGDFLIQSPRLQGRSGSAESGQAGGSPWRIRVTVEADDAAADSAPAGAEMPVSTRARPQSRTFKVPLRDAGGDGSPSPRKRPARRKITDDEAFNGTPKPPSAAKMKPRATAAKRKSYRRKSGAVEDIASGPDEGASHPVTEAPTPSEQPVKRRPGRPRKDTVGTTPTTSSKPLVQIDGTVSDAEAAPIPQPEPVARASHMPTQIAEDAQPQRPARQLKDYSDLQPLQERFTDHGLSAPAFGEASHIRSLKGDNHMASKPTNSVGEQESREQIGNDQDVAQLIGQGVSAEDDPAEDGVDDRESVQETTERTVNPDEAEPGQGFEQSAEDELSELLEYEGEEVMGQDEDQVAEDSTRALDRSVAESEGFTMVSLASLKTKRAQGLTPQQRPSNRQAPQDPSSQPAAIAPPRDFETGGRANEGENQRSGQTSRSNVPNLRAQNSPFLPPTMHSSPAGLAPRQIRESAEQLLANRHPATRGVDNSGIRPSTNPFDAYGSGTRRELRKVFKSGGALAPKASVNNARSNDAAHPTDAAQNGGPPNSVLTGARAGETRLPTPADSVRDESSSSVRSHDEMSWKPTTLPRSATQEQAKEASSSKSNNNHRSRPQLHAPVPAAYDEMSWEPTAQAVLQQSRDLKRRGEELLQRMSQQGDAGKVGENRDTDASLDIASSPPIPRQGMRVSSGRPSDQQDGAETGANKTAPSPRPDQSDIWYDEADRSLEDSMTAQRERRRPAREALARPKPEFSHLPTQSRASASGAPANEPAAPTPQRRSIGSFNRAVPSPIPSLSDLLPSDDRPTRAKIPRTWRRASASDFLYSDEAESPRQSLPARAPPKDPTILAGHKVPSVFARWTKGAASTQQADDQTIRENEERHVTPVDHQQPLKGILSSPARRASSPAKEVRWVPDDDLEDMNSAEEENGADAYFSSSDESETSKMNPDDQVVDVDRDGNQRHRPPVEDVEDTHDQENEDESADELQDYSGSEIQTSPVCQTQAQSRPRHPKAPLNSIPPPHQGTKRLISALISAKHDAAGNSSLLQQPSQKRPRVFDDPSIHQGTPLRHSTQTATGSSQTCTLRRVHPVQETRSKSFLSSLGKWLFPPSIITPIPRSTAVPAHLRASPAKTERQLLELEKPPYTWTSNQARLLRHYIAYATHLSSPDTTAVPPGPPINPHYHDPLKSIPRSLSRLAGVDMPAQAYCATHSPPLARPAPGLLVRWGLVRDSGVASMYESRNEASCAYAGGGRCPGIPAEMEGRQYVYAFTERDVRVVWAFISEVKTRGLPLIYGTGKAGSETSGIQRDEQGRVKRVRQDWGAGDAERVWLVDRVVAYMLDATVREEEREAASRQTAVLG